MEVFLHKKDMPKNCICCCFLGSKQYETICILLQKWIEVKKDKRLIDCPLKAVEQEVQKVLNDWIGRERKC